LLQSIDVDRLDAHRSFYAQLVTALPGLPSDPRIREAFASVPRERFVGPGPWKIFTRGGYLDAPTDDPAFLYQDFGVALKPEREINNGQPSLHALCLTVLGSKDGEVAVHVGAGTGYYSAILAKLVGPGGRVHAIEIDEDLARRAAANLASAPNVTVHHRSGTEGELPSCDVVYVNAGTTEPARAWLDALRVGGRLLFPLTTAQLTGGLLLVKREDETRYSARFVCPASFVPCVGARDDETAAKLAEAFKRGNLAAVRSLRRDDRPDETAWVVGRGWWLSAAEA